MYILLLFFYQLFKLEDRPETTEVYFSQAYQKACRTVQGLLGSDTPSTGKSGLQAIAKAAAAGLATASVTDVADDILKFPTLPKLPVIENCDTLPKNIAQNFDPNNLPVMILMDLMLSSAKTWDVCNKLMVSIKPLLPTSSQTSNLVSQTTEGKTSSAAVSKQRVSKIRTFHDFCVQIQSVLSLGADGEVPSKEQMMMSKAFQKSIQHFLCNCTLSLTADKNREYATLCQSLSKYVCKAEEAFNQHRSRSKSHMRSESPGRPMRSESPVSRSLQEKPGIHHCMKQLIRVLEKDIPAQGVLCLLNRLVFFHCQRG